MAPPIRARSRFPHSQSLPPEASCPYLSENRHNANDNHRKLIKLITWITACLTQWNYEPCLVGLPKIDGPWWRVLTKCGPLEERMAHHSSILAMRIPWTIWKGKKTWHQKMSPPHQKVSNMLLGKSRGQLLIAPERMKQLGQSRNNAPLWMYLVVKVKSDVVKNNIT